MSDFPHRIRLHGGRNTHAARPVNGGPDLVTACDYMAVSKDQRLDDSAPVNCRACGQRIKKEQQ
ncbi:hypothetical protein [Streptomyces sp. NPDC015125]|uniref:hypothetical protein n=1 Tax=Streptomyces sp. NPDC015125 TaxID=3364938 RepID=UPI0036FE6ED9